MRLLPLKRYTHYALEIMLKLMLRRVTTFMCYGTIIPLYNFCIEVNKKFIMRRPCPVACYISKST
jgi:hypothetical protein